ncbi:MAG: hypothetical protein ACI9WS_003378 [Paraglaciecola psychrophila]
MFGNSVCSANRVSNPLRVLFTGVRESVEQSESIYITSQVKAVVSASYQRASVR